MQMMEVVVKMFLERRTIQDFNTLYDDNDDK